MGNTVLAEKASLSPHELDLLASEMKKRAKSRLTLWLLWLFTGVVGGHRYYLGDIGRGLLQTAFFVLCVVLAVDGAFRAETEVEMVYASLSLSLYMALPGLWALIDAAFIGRRLRVKNERIEARIIEELKGLRSQADLTTAP